MGNKRWNRNTSSTKPDSTGSNRFPDLLTVGQAHEYLHTKGLNRTTKTIRKWCRLRHVETKSNTIPGGPKWLIVLSSLDAKIEEEKITRQTEAQYPPLAWPSFAP